MTVEDINKKSRDHNTGEQQSSQRMIENFSKENYAYIDGPVIGHTNVRQIKEEAPYDDEEQMSNYINSKKQLTASKSGETYEGHTMSGKTTAKIMQTGEEEDESK